MAYRDYSNAYTAQFAIEKDKIFREIGYADELGSGMRNTNKYTKLYSGGTPVFIEGNIFEIVIPMDNVAQIQIGPEETNKETNKETSKETSKETNKEIYYKILDILEIRPDIAVKEIAGILNISVGGVRYHINKMKKAGIVAHIGSTKKGKWIIFK